MSSMKIVDHKTAKFFFVLGLIASLSTRSESKIKDIDDQSDFEFDESAATSSWLNSPSARQNNDKYFQDIYGEDSSQSSSSEEDEVEEFKPIISKETMCRNVRCSKHEKCVMKNNHAAVCVKKKKWRKKPNNHKSKYLFCETCTVVPTSFVCGSDNRTYSSVCRLNYHNCVHKKSIQVLCQEFCPCSENADFETVSKKKIKAQKWSNIYKKYHSTLAKKRMFSQKIKRKKIKAARTLMKLKSTVVEDKNEVNKMPIPKYFAKECSSKELEMMGNRLLDWFSVLRTNSKLHKEQLNEVKLKNKVKFPMCMKEVQWMFEYLDKNDDGRLSLKELYTIEHDEHEHCIKPFIDKCDFNRDIFLHTYEWCKCFDKSERPCAAMRSKSRGLLGAYIPSCDIHGFFNPTQCHIGLCWCVDRHGLEVPHTRSKGHKNCESILKKKKYDHNDDEEDALSEEDIEGSADDYRS